MQFFDQDEPRDTRVLKAIAFVASAALAAIALRFAVREPFLVGLVAGPALAIWALRYQSRRRLRRILQSGDVASVLAKWSPSLARVPHPATMTPLMAATAFAAYGWVDKARTLLATAERGPAWDAALEHRLFLDTMLLTFEGDRDGALEQAARLARLPVPRTAPALRDRIMLLRRAMGALARAFAHQSQGDDAEVLQHASDTSPLIFWAMRYAAAVIAVDCGDAEKAKTLLSDAPNWPAQSAFRAFHDEIAAHAGLEGQAAHGL